MTDVTDSTDRLRRTSARRFGAVPAVAAAFAAGIAYVWLEAGWRLLFTYFPDFNARWVLWNGRVGDIAAMWLTISVIAVAVYLVLFVLWRRKERIGSVVDWTILLIGSAVAAPMIGEIGQATGSPVDGAGSTDANAVIAYVILSLTVLVVGGILVRIHRPRD